LGFHQNLVIDNVGKTFSDIMGILCILSWEYISVGNIYIYVYNLAGGIPIHLKNITVVSWDNDIPNIWKNKKVPNHQPDNKSSPK